MLPYSTLAFYLWTHSKSGRPAEAKTEENIQKVKDMMIDRSMNQSFDIPIETGICKASVVTILHKDLDMNKAPGIKFVKKPMAC